MRFFLAFPFLFGFSAPPPNNLAFTFLSFIVQDLPVLLLHKLSRVPPPPTEATSILTTVLNARSRSCEHGCRKREYCLALPIRYCPLAFLLSPVIISPCSSSAFSSFLHNLSAPCSQLHSKLVKPSLAFGDTEVEKGGQGRRLHITLLQALSWSFWEPLPENRERHREERRGYFWIRGELLRPGRRVFIEPTLRAEMLASPEPSLG